MVFWQSKCWSDNGLKWSILQCFFPHKCSMPNRREKRETDIEKTREREPGITETLWKFWFYPCFAI